MKSAIDKRESKTMQVIIHRSAFVAACLLVTCHPALVSDLCANRLITSGFETNNLLQTEWDAIPTQNGTLAFTTSSPRSGTYALQASQGGSAGSNIVQRALSAAQTSGTEWVQFAFKIVTDPGSYPHNVFCFRNSGGSSGGGGPLELHLISGPKLAIRNRLTSTTTNGTTTLSTNTWYVVQVKVVIADSPNGAVELKIDGNVEATQNSTDTLDGSNGMRGINIGGQAGDGATSKANWEYHFDDVLPNDSNGTFQIDYPDLASKLALLKPGSNDTVTWTKTGANCSGTTNTDCVDDEPGTPDDTSGYNTSSTANNEDRLNTASLPAEVPSNADMISLTLLDRWDGNGTTGTRQGRHLVWDEGGTQTNGPTHSRCDVTAGTWSLASTAQITVFDLGTRSKANVESFDLGYEPLNTAECRITAIWANVEWKPAAAAAPAKRRRMVVW